MTPLRIPVEKLPPQILLNKWELALLMVPAGRVLLYLFGLAPGTISSSVLPHTVQLASLTLLGIGTGVSMLGVLRQSALLEKRGLQVVGPMSAVYAIVLICAGQKSALFSILMYLVFAGVAWLRSKEIKLAVRITRRALGGDG